MGGGAWTTSSYVKHSTTSRGFASMDEFKAASAQELYRSHRLDPTLNPKGVVRECCDSEEHPNTKPVILGLDVTGSMGKAAEEVAKQLNDIMTSAYDSVTDVEFMTMAIGDLSYDDAPIQVSQFESDIRIAEQLEKVWFEGGGGGNSWESYTAAWYFGLNNTKLDCYNNRGQKGLIITIGDEPLNPYLPGGVLGQVLGTNIQGDVETKDLYKDACEKFNIWHIGFKDRATSYERYKNNGKMKGWQDLLGDHFVEATAQTLASVIADIIDKSFNNDSILAPASTDGIAW
jgi:hypothetical protein